MRSRRPYPSWRREPRIQKYYTAAGAAALTTLAGVLSNACQAAVADLGHWTIRVMVCILKLIPHIRD
jgi:hypothetical protein